MEAAATECRCTETGVDTPTRDRLAAYWNGEPLDRPILHVRAKRPGYRAPAWNGPFLSAKEKDLCPEWHAHTAEARLDSCLYLGDAIPNAGVDFASNLGLLAVLAGGDYHYDRNNQAWVDEWPEVYDAPLPRFKAVHPVVRTLESCVTAMAEAVGDRGYISPPTLLDGITLLSLFRTPAALCMDLLERPDDVKRWSRALTILGRDLFEHFYRLLLRLGYGQCSSWVPIMAHGRVELVQGDFGVMLSPADFEEFVLPDVRFMTEYLDFSAYHLDGAEQMRFLDLLATLPRLRGIQWNPSPSNGPLLDWMESFRRIRERGMVLMWNEFEIGNAENAAAITRELGPDGLAFVLPVFESPAEAEEALRRIEAAAEPYRASPGAGVATARAGGPAGPAIRG